MIYVWKDKHTEIVVEVSRPMKEIDTPPDKDEALAVGMDVHNYAEAEWERLMNAPVFAGPKNKGNW